MKKPAIIASIIFVLYLALVVGIGFLVHLTGRTLLLFCIVLGLVGAAALAIFLIWKKKQLDAKGPVLEAGAAEADALAQLVKAADARLKSSPGGAKSLAGMPLVYVLGDENSGKTQTVLQSGLDAELMSGAVHRDGMVAPTQLANLWYTPGASVVEAGGALLKQPGLWQRLVSLTQPNKLGTALSKNALQPTRAAVLCVSIERITANNSAEAIKSLAQMMNDRLRLLSQTLGISLPVYVVFTKLDTIPSFGDYVTNLTDEEVRAPLGALLTPVDASTGMYADKATQQAAARFDELCYSLSEYRLEVLSRGGTSDRLAKAYEFPRELRKMRGPIVDMLVEVGRPSQLGVNPFLRGFYFVGMRARTVEETVASPQAAAAAAPAADAGATRIFSFNAMQQQAAPTAAPQRVSRRVPQWCFLPFLFPGVIFNDRSALDASRASTKVNGVKRFLIASVATCLFLYFILLTVSYFNNSALEGRLKTAAGLPMTSVSKGDPASLSDLQNLEQLRVIFAQIAGYRKDGAPMMYRWGLYPGEKLYTAACTAYGERFRTALLTPTQGNILARLTALPAAPLPTDEYTATYRPLRAYLITTSNPDKSTTDFLPDALQTAWIGSRTVGSDVTDLSHAQFETYAETLPEPASCMKDLGGPPRMPAVTQARAYLGHFQGIEQVYLSMKAAANKKFGSIVFNEKFPASVKYVNDPFRVEGAFSKGGYEFMQKAFADPREYTSGEEWVLGQGAGQSIDIGTVKAQLPGRYLADFLAAWRGYLKGAHVIQGAGWPEHKEKLHQLDSPGSALGQLFMLISQNTAVKDPAYSTPFQAPQAVVAPTSTSPTLPQGYTAALSGLEGAIGNMVLMPGYANDPAAAQPVIAASGQAEAAVNTIRATFTPPDPAGGMDSTSEALLLAPIRSVQGTAKAAPAAATGGGGKTLCMQLAPIFSKFPLNPDSHDDATQAEIATALGPQGAIAQYAAAQSKMITLAGNQYVETPGSVVTVNPAFLHFLNQAQMIAAALLPPNNAPAKVDFSMLQESTPNLPPASLTIDGNTLSTSGAVKSFSWVSNPSSSIRLNAAAGYNIPASGPWSLFHFAYGAKHPAPNRLEFIFQVNGQTATSEKGVPLDYKFDVSGPGAPLLNPAYMRGLHCVAKVAQ